MDKYNEQAEIQHQLSENENSKRKERIRAEEFRNAYLRDVLEYLPYLSPLINKISEEGKKLFALELDVRNKINEHFDSKK